MKRSGVLLLCIVIGLLGHGQELVTWNFSAKKIADRTFEIHLTPTVKQPWHIYSQTSPEDAALPTKISFNKNPLVIFDGKTKEIGKIVSKYEDVFEATVKYFEGDADFVQIIKLKSNEKTNISGSIAFMACNDQQCTPPATVNFLVNVE